MNHGRPNSFSLIRQDKRARALSVLRVALDDLMRWEDLPGLDYLKIDVEGAEAEVIRGARKSLETFRPIVQAEVNIRDLDFDLPDYTAFQAPGSANKIFLPNESSKLSIPAELGWSRISSPQAVV